LVVTKDGRNVRLARRLLALAVPYQGQVCPSLTLSRDMIRRHESTTRVRDDDMAARLEVAAHASIKDMDVTVYRHARRQPRLTADHRLHQRAAPNVSKIKATPTRCTSSVFSPHAGKHSVQSSDDAKLFRTSAALSSPQNTCRATSAVSRWVDGVATQFVSLT
jgi:hypothetical protein